MALSCPRVCRAHQWRHSFGAALWLHAIQPWAGVARNNSPTPATPMRLASKPLRKPTFSARHRRSTTTMQTIRSISSFGSLQLTTVWGKMGLLRASDYASHEDVQRVKSSRSQSISSVPERLSLLTFPIDTIMQPTRRLHSPTANRRPPLPVYHDSPRLGLQ